MYMLAKSWHLPEKMPKKLATMVASGKGSLHFSVYLFVAFEFCTLYLYYLCKNKISQWVNLPIILYLRTLFVSYSTFYDLQLF